MHRKVTEAAVEPSSSVAENVSVCSSTDPPGPGLLQSYVPVPTVTLPEVIVVVKTCDWLPRAW